MLLLSFVFMVLRVSMSTPSVVSDVLAPYVGFITGLVDLVLSYDVFTHMRFETSLVLNDPVMTLSTGPEDGTLWIEASATMYGRRADLQLLQIHKDHFELVTIIPVFPVYKPIAFLQTPQRDRMYFSTRHETDRLKVLELATMTWGSQSLLLSEPAPRFLCYENDRLYFSGDNAITYVSPDLSASTRFALMPAPMGMAWYQDELHVVSYRTKSVWVWNRQGKYLRQWGYPHLHHP